MVRISSGSEKKEHFSKRVDRPSGEQKTKQWQSRIASEEKAAYSGRLSSTPSTTPTAVTKFVDKLRETLLKIVHAKGGTEFSILRHTFLDWDADRSGELGLVEFRNAMCTLGVRGTDDEYNAVISHFDVEGDGEMRYEPLVNEVVKGTAHWLHHPSTADVNERRAKKNTGEEIVNLDLAKAMLKNSPGVKKSYGMSARSPGSGSARSNISGMSRQKLLDSARKSSRSGMSGTSARSARSAGSAGATAVRLLQEQLEEERKKREKVEKELEELRAAKSRGRGGEGKEEKEDVKEADEEFRKFKDFKKQGGVLEP